MKQRLYDTVALAGALIVLVAAILLLPSFWPVYQRAVIGLVFFGLIAALYLALRPPDTIILLAKELEAITADAKKIRQANLIGNAAQLQDELDEVAVEMARLAIKILERKDFQRFATQIHRLHLLSENFLKLTWLLTGVVSLRSADFQQEVEEFSEQHLPQALETLRSLNEDVDAELAKQVIMAESEIKIVNRLSARNNQLVLELNQILAGSSKER